MKRPKIKRKKVTDPTRQAVDKPYASGVVYIGDEEVDLMALDGFSKLNPAQRRYLTEYANCDLRKRTAALRSGVLRSDLDRWEAEDHVFLALLDEITDLHIEILEGIELSMGRKPQTGGVARARTLDVRSKVYRKKSQGININLNNQPPPPQVNTVNILSFNRTPEAELGLAGAKRYLETVQQAEVVVDTVERKRPAELSRPAGT